MQLYQYISLTHMTKQFVSLLVDKSVSTTVKIKGFQKNV